MSIQPNKEEQYRVLARKYRPQSFDELIGQDALVRTLTNAISSGRIAHAFMLTGVRGVGKTTTARIIAKALNYKGADGTAGPTTGSTQDCGLCQAISEDRHPDVIEMDAASRTGIDDIREILDGVRYAPTEARYKIYIIDEVHMLSKNAFNALLKTLEEPPEHVKFIFATTEIRKVPITVLSRCQRFDLRRVDIPTLEAHFKKICSFEKITPEDEAISLIARASDGSVRDGLSLLDQAMALATTTEGSSTISGQQIKEMLGLADRARSLDLIEHALSGNMPEALALMDELYASGADPVTLVQDLMDLSHILTRLRAVPGTKAMKYAMSADEVARAAEMAKNISMPSLGKTWKILLNGLGEVQSAPNPQRAAEMVIIRLTYAADLPDPSDLIKRLKDNPQSSSDPTSKGAPTSAPARESAPVALHAVSRSRGQGQQEQAQARAVATAASIPTSTPVQNSTPVPEETSLVQTAIHTLEDVVNVLQQNKELVLASHISHYINLVSFKEGLIEIALQDNAPPKLTQNLSKALQNITGQRWVVSISRAQGAPTLAEQEKLHKKQDMDNVLALPVIKQVLEIFPEAKLTEILPKVERVL